MLMSQSPGPVDMVSYPINGRGWGGCLDFPGGPSVITGSFNMEAGGQGDRETDDAMLLASVIKEGTTGAKGCRHF